MLHLIGYVYKDILTMHRPINVKFKENKLLWSKCLKFVKTEREGLVCHHLMLNPLNPKLNPICYLLALLGAHHFLHVSRIRVKSLTFRLLMSHIYM